VIVVLIVVAAVAIVVVFWFVLRRPRQDPGIVGFRRHIDALSPESRQEMKDRMREQQAERPDQTDGPG
jgi:flagellar basal body-associated protein FliL